MSKLSTRRYVDKLFELQAKEIDRRFHAAENAIALAKTGAHEVKDDNKAAVGLWVAVAGVVIALGSTMLGLIGTGVALFVALRH